MSGVTIYKDSKEINLLVGALILDVYILAPLWLTFQGTASPIWSWLAYNFGTLTRTILPKTIVLVVQSYQSDCSLFGDIIGFQTGC